MRRKRQGKGILHTGNASTKSQVRSKPHLLEKLKAGLLRLEWSAGEWQAPNELVEAGTSWPPSCHSLPSVATPRPWLRTVHLPSGRVHPVPDCLGRFRECLLDGGASRFAHPPRKYPAPSLPFLPP
jgi:hypothetical protein